MFRSSLLVRVDRVQCVRASHCTVVEPKTKYNVDEPFRKRAFR
jgi:hypothetical protein